MKRTRRQFTLGRLMIAIAMIAVACSLPREIALDLLSLLGLLVLLGMFWFAAIVPLLCILLFRICVGTGGHRASGTESSAQS